MDWIVCIKEAINYMEKNLLSIESPEEVARHVNCSALYLQRGFQVLTGHNVGEYMRNRKMYMAALDLCNSDKKVIDIAFDYGYETPESFTKAFSRFHGASPSEVRCDKGKVRTFLPLKLAISIQGGENMTVKIEKMGAIKVIGFTRNFEFETSQAEIPKFWNEIFSKFGKAMMLGTKPTNALEKAVVDNCIGEYGVCVDDSDTEGQFRYFIAGIYNGGEVPEGIELYEIPAHSWAKFDCVGPMPTALQSVNNYIWNEWLPGNEDYELDGAYNIEWYSGEGKTSDSDYKSAIWLPVKSK